jgi:tetratricopeptide (TPR) repeat protein
MFLALVAHEHGEEGRATNLFEETLRAARQGGDENLAGIAINNLGDIALRGQDFAAATSRFEESLAISRVLGNSTAVASDLSNLALSLYASGRHEEAVRTASESLLLAQEAEAIVPLVMGIALAATVAADNGRPDVAATLFGKTASLCEEVDLELTGFEGELREKSSERVRRLLRDEPYATAFARGQIMTLDDALQLALAAID